MGDGRPPSRTLVDTKTAICGACGREEKRPIPRVCLCGVEGAWLRTDIREHPHPVRPALELESPPRLSELEEPTDERLATGDRTVDRLLAAGFGLGESVLVHGPKGSGKSRCCLRWASRAGGLVVNLEMSPAILRHTAASAGAELERLHVIDDADHWQGAAELCRARVVVFDSVSRLPEHAVDWVRSAIQWGRVHGVPLLFLSHENKRGQPSGPNALQHDPDSVFRLENARADGTARLVVKKRRLSPLGSCRVELVPGALERLKHRGQRLRSKVEQSEVDDQADE